MTVIFDVADIQKIETRANDQVVLSLPMKAITVQDEKEKLAAPTSLC